jgi:hypothetical protein
MIKSFVLFLCLCSVSLSGQNPPTMVSDTILMDTSKSQAIPIMTFDKKTINFGKIKTGDKPEVIYNFTNTGNKELSILIVSGCDCTALDWTRTTVPPGGKGFIKAIFNSTEAEEEDHKRPLKKTIDIILNQSDPVYNYPIVEILDFEVFIID